MSKFIVKFEIPSRRTYDIACTSEALPQWALADFIQSITEAEYTLLGVDTVEGSEPEAVYGGEEEEEEELCAEDIVEMDWNEDEEELYIEEEEVFE